MSDLTSVTAPQLAACIGCGCDDVHACYDATRDAGCYWLRIDYADGKGVCSSCPEHAEAWDRGDRTDRSAPNPQPTERNDMNTAVTALLATLTMPTLAEGEIYAGLALEDAAWHHLILLPEAEPKPASWQKQLEWAKAQGGDLPTRREQSVLYGNLPGEFKEGWYWSSTPYAGDEAYAWFQNFSYGDQCDGRKASKLRARAVRRIAI